MFVRYHSIRCCANTVTCDKANLAGTWGHHTCYEQTWHDSNRFYITYHQTQLNENNGNWQSHKFIFADYIRHWFPCMAVSWSAINTRKCSHNCRRFFYSENPDSKVRVAKMGPTWVLAAPGGPHLGPANLAIRELMMLRCSTTGAASSSAIVTPTESDYLFMSDLLSYVCADWP